MPDEERSTLPLLIVIVLLVSFASYFNTLFNGFVYDDVQNILQNRWIKDIRYVPQIFSSNLAGFDSEYATSYYRPVVHILFMISYYVFGLKPWGFHLVNIIFLSGTSILVFLLTSRVLRGSQPSTSNDFFHFSLSSGQNRGTIRIPASFVAAVLFATHPIHTEPVAWVSGIMDLSFTFFYLFSFYLYVYSTDNNTSLKGVPFLLSVLSFLLATLCKEPALTLPVILVVYDFVFRKAGSRLSDNFKRYVPYFIVVGIYFILRLYALRGFVPNKNPVVLTDYQYLINIFPLFMQYIGKLILPLNLNTMYVFHPVVSVFELKSMISIILTLTLVVFTYVTRKNKVIFFSLVLTVVPLLPALYIPALGPRVFAERYLYLPSYGFIILFVMLFARIKIKIPGGQLIVGLILLSVLGLYSAATASRNSVWKDSYSLWMDTVKKSPQNAVSHEYFGYALYARGQIDEAIEQYQIALSLDLSNRERADTEINLGVAYASKGWIDKALEHYQAALSLTPYNAKIYNDQGLIYSDKGMIDQAIEKFEIALRLKPDFAEAYNGLGVVYGNNGLIDKSIEHFEAAVKLDPTNQGFAENLNKAYEIKNAGDKAGAPGR